METIDKHNARCKHDSQTRKWRKWKKANYRTKISFNISFNYKYTNRQRTSFQAIQQDGKNEFPFLP